MKDITIFKKKALAVLSTGIILTSYAGCNLDENNLVESENTKQSTMEMVQATETEKIAEKESLNENNKENTGITDREALGAAVLSLILGSMASITMIWSKEKYNIMEKWYIKEQQKEAAKALELDNKQKTYHK